MKKTLILAACMMLLAACSQDTSLSISSDIASYRFDADGGAFDAIIFTNGSWTATCEDETVSLTPSSGDYTTPMHIVVGANEEYYTKSIRITLNTKLDNLSRSGKIVITQDCRPFIFCQESRVNLTAQGGKARFSVNADGRAGSLKLTFNSIYYEKAVIHAGSMPFRPGVLRARTCTFT